MTTPSTPSTPSATTLLGKLRALEEQRNDSRLDVYAHRMVRSDLADLLPQIIAQIEQLTTERDEAQRYYIDCVLRYTAIGG